MGFIFALFLRIRSWALVFVCPVVIFGTTKTSLASNDRAIQFFNSAYYEASMRLDTLPQLTIETWIRLDSTFQSGWPTSYGGDSSGFGLYLYENLTPGFPSPIMIASGYQHPSITGNSIRMPLGGWVHISFTKNDSIWTLYRNGMLVGRGALNVAPSDSILRIGRFSGAMQQLRIWSFARTGEEIRADVFRVMTDTEQGLYASFAIDSLTGDSIEDGIHGFVLRLKGPLSSITNIPSRLALGRTLAPKVFWNKLPAHLQFLPRKESDYGIISIGGSISQEGYDSIVITKLRNDQIETRFAFPLNYIVNSASFGLEDSILAEPALY